MNLNRVFYMVSFYQCRFIRLEGGALHIDGLSDGQGDSYIPLTHTPEKHTHTHTKPFCLLGYINQLISTRSNVEI